MAEPADALDLRFGVVVPVYNESRFPRLLERFDVDTLSRVVVVDDGSTDDSTAVAERYPVTRLRHASRRGVGAALRTGLAHLQQRKIEIAVIMAGNTKDDPTDIPLLLEAIRRGADYVQGSRYLEPGRAQDTPVGRRVITRAVACLWSARFMRRLTDVTNGFRAYRMTLLDDSRIDLSQEWLDRYELEYYLHYKALALGYRYAEVPVWKRYPTDGLPTSKIRLGRDTWSLLRPFVLLTLRLRN